MIDMEVETLSVAADAQFLHNFCNSEIVTAVVTKETDTLVVELLHKNLNISVKNQA